MAEHYDVRNTLLLLLLLNAAHRLIRSSARVAVSERDGGVHLPLLWPTPLVGENAGEKAAAQE